MKQLFPLIATLAALASISLAGCTSNNFQAGKTRKPADTQPISIQTPAVIRRRNITRHDNSFDIIAVEKEGYWYSRYVLGQLMARAGFGEKLLPEKETMPKMMAKADKDFNMAKFKAGDKSYGDGDHFSPPVNPHLIRTVYAGGDPHFTRPIDTSDFATLRWDSGKMDKTYTGEAFGWMMLKEGEWAKNFHNPGAFGKPDDSIGAQWRTVGMILVAEAKETFNSYLKLKESGSIRMNDRDKIVMLEAISSLYGLVTDADEYPLTRDDKIAPLLKNEAMSLHGEFETGHDYQNLKNASLSAQATVWFVSEVGKNEARGEKDIERTMNRLLAFTPYTPAERAYYIRALVEGQRLLGKNYPQIRAEFKKLRDDFDWDNGYFASQSTYTIDDIGSILGALNALKIFPQDGVDKEDVKQMMISFFESAVNLSGLMQSAPPVEAGKSPFEYKNAANIFFRYPSIPLPPKAGGEYGIAPVFAKEIFFDSNSQKWHVIDGNWDTAGGMHAANEFIWFQYPKVNGFPDI